MHDGEVLGDLLHGEETRVWGDRAYQGKREVIREHAPRARDFTNKRERRNGVVDEIKRAKSKVRARVEHAIGVIRRLFGLAKVRYRGIAKNADHLFVAAALAR